MKSSGNLSVFSSGNATHDLAFNAVFASSYGGLVYFAYKMIGDKQEAEDAVQNAFISYWNVKKNVGSAAHIIKSFLYTTVRNTCLDILKHQTVVRKFRDQLEADPVDEKDIEQEIIRAEVLGEIFRAIELLPPGCRQVLEMSYLLGKKNQEIAEELQISINTVKTQKQRALQLLKMNLTSNTFPLLLLFLSL